MLDDVFSRIQRIDYLIRIRGTGNATELADKLGLSRASIYEYLDLMKRLGAPIKYSQARKSYYYNEEGCFPTRFQSRRAAEDRNIASFSAIISFALLSNCI
ncbi:HTH domain-containing protein [Chitinophaga sp. S165]|uniref:HTH domain-containing protein n=1 Tax=Chitinophaga sp. S165 TaxID=2135462 RepID=UPI000D70D823|nr:HTH domain-containing protein [Chitinophaga sp. S165]PWV51926.1 HTH domain-containing protein [Chitinophaga sp. S165]